MRNNKLRSENNWLKSALVFAVIIILLFKNKIQEYLCSCECEPEGSGDESPDDSGFSSTPMLGQDKAIIDVEAFERSEDQDVTQLNLDVVANYVFGNDTLEIFKNNV